MDLCVMPEMIKSFERKPHDGTQHACEVHLSCGCHCLQDPFYSNFSQPSAPGSHISQIHIPTWAVLLSEKFSTQAMKVACPNSIECWCTPSFTNNAWHACLINCTCWRNQEVRTHLQLMEKTWLIYRVACNFTKITCTQLPHLAKVPKTKDYMNYP